MSDQRQFTRRGRLKTAGGIALVSGMSAPAILRAQTADVIRIGHLTPRLAAQELVGGNQGIRWNSTPSSWSSRASAWLVSP